MEYNTLAAENRQQLFTSLTGAKVKRENIYAEKNVINLGRIDKQVQDLKLKKEMKKTKMKEYLRIYKKIQSKKKQNPKLLDDSELFDSSDDSGSKRITVSKEKNDLLLQKFPTFTSSFMSLDSSGNNAQAWLQEYPVDKSKVVKESKKFRKFNKGNPILFINDQEDINGFPEFQILEDKQIDLLPIEMEESESSFGSDININTKLLKPIKTVKTLRPSQWDLNYQNAQQYINNSKKNKPAEKMDCKDFMAWLNKRGLRNLEKHEYYFERSPSLVQDFSNMSKVEKEAWIREKEFQEKKLNEQKLKGNAQWRFQHSIVETMSRLKRQEEDYDNFKNRADIRKLDILTKTLGRNVRSLNKIHRTLDDMRSNEVCSKFTPSVPEDPVNLYFNR